MTFLEHSTQEQKNIYLSSAYGIFINIDYILGHGTSLNIFKRIKVKADLFLDHNRIKLIINNNMISGKIPNVRKQTGAF